MQDSDNKSLKQRLFKNLSLYHVVAILIVFIVITAYVFNFYNQKISLDAGDWGTFGDFMGGVLNPAFSLLAFFTLLKTIQLQQEELRLTREELAKSSESQALQTQIFEQQLFEQSFFTLLNLYNEALEKAQTTYKIQLNAQIADADKHITFIQEGKESQYNHNNENKVVNLLNKKLLYTQKLSENKVYWDNYLIEELPFNMSKLYNTILKNLEKNKNLLSMALHIIDLLHNTKLKSSVDISRYMHIIQNTISDNLFIGLMFYLSNPDLNHKEEKYIKIINELGILDSVRFSHLSFHEMEISRNFNIVYCFIIERNCFPKILEENEDIKKFKDFIYSYYDSIQYKDENEKQRVNWALQTFNFLKHNSPAP